MKTGFRSRLTLMMGTPMLFALVSCGSAVTLDASTSPSGIPDGPIVTAPLEATTTTVPSSESDIVSTTRFRVADPLTGTTIFGCEASEGSSLDLSAEPAEWLVWDSYLRWNDTGGCPVRLDVVAHVRGSDRCGWRGAEFITMGRPVGDPIGKRYSVDSTSRFLWDPDAVLPRGPFGETLPLGDLPEGLVDSGFRLPAVTRSLAGTQSVDQTADPGIDGEFKLYVDNLEDPTMLYLVGIGEAFANGESQDQNEAGQQSTDRVEVWHKHPSLGLCG